MNIFRQRQIIFFLMPDFFVKHKSGLRKQKFALENVFCCLFPDFNLSSRNTNFGKVCDPLIKSMSFYILGKED